MKDIKICVYAMCKNESQFVDPWVSSMSEADKIIVSDTGSDDDTVEKLKSLGVEVHEINVDPWRFDIARNMSLSFVPEEYDILVCTDLDERFNEGWATILRENLKEDTTRVSYNYNFSFDDLGKPETTFYINKIHRNKIYEWTHPIHEVLTIKEGNETIQIIEGITLNHYQDFTKSRKSYLPLLELSVLEDPLDDRNIHYLGREYMYYGMYDKCIETLKKHLELESATWKDERCASMRFIGRSYLALGKREEAKEWFIKAVNESPYLREPYVELGKLYFDELDYKNASIYLSNALKIKNKSLRL